MLLSLVDAEYRFLWSAVGSSGSSPDAQIFNRNKLKKAVENTTLWLTLPELVEEGSPGVHYFLLGEHLGEHLFLDAMVYEKLWQKTTPKGRENAKLQDLRKQDGCGECLWNSL